MVFITFIVSSDLKFSEKVIYVLIQQKIESGKNIKFLF